MHLAPPRVTISRPKTAALGVDAGRSASESGPSSPPPPSLSATLANRRTSTAFEHHGRQNKLLTAAPASCSSANHVAVPTRSPVRPTSSSSSANAAGKTVVSPPRAGATTSLRKQESSAARAQSAAPSAARTATQLPPPLSASLALSADTTGNIYHAMAARKSAEDTAKQLARRIAHFRAQEERVLREVQQVKSRLESALVATHQHERQQPSCSTDDSWTGINERVRQGWVGHHGAAVQTTRARTRREPQAPRSRDQLQFLTKQKKVLQMQKLESAKHQKEKRKLALEKQKLKEEADKRSKVVQKEKIRQEYQRALDQRASMQHQLLEVLENQHDKRLQLEKEREQHARELVEQLREEEKHVVLRLQALKFHQEFIQRNDCSSSSSSGSGADVVVVAPRFE